jgi:aminoglycoside 6'-N-acetyltransferase
MSLFRSSGSREQRPNAGADAIATQLPTVVLRDITEGDAPFIEELQASLADDEWDGYDDDPEDRLSSSIYGGGGAIIERGGGTAVGTVSWIQVPHGPNRQSLAWCIGITVAEMYRGQHVGAAAQRELCVRLFRDSLANRVEAETDVDNIAERRSLERAGFSFEGVARKSNWRRGHWHDMAIYSMLRHDLT